MGTNFPNGLRSRGVPLPSGGMPPTGGNVFHVDSGHASASDSGPGTNPNHPMSTLDATIALCTANNGDQIWVYPGHAETVSAVAGLDLDIAGITIVFLGNGNDRGTITFGTVVGADMDVDAADITLINPRFVAGIDALTGPIDVNAARFRMYGATWHDATTINTTDCVVADANANDMVIKGFEFVDGDGAGTQKQSFIQVAGATRPTLQDIKCTGDFGTGVIENGTAWIDALLEALVLDNASASPTVCLLLQATSSGWVRNSSLRVASGTPPVGYTAANDMQFDNVAQIGADATPGGVGLLGTISDAAATGAVTNTDTLMAYIKQIITMLGPTELDTDTLGEILMGTAGITTFPAAAIPGNAVSLAEVIRQLYAALEGTAADQNGVATWPTAAAPGNNVSIAEALREVYDQEEKAVATAAAVIANGTATIFTVAGGPIKVLNIMSVCVTGNDATATTLKYTADPTDGGATDLCAASASLTNAVAGTIVNITGTLANAAVVTAAGTAIAQAGAVVVPVGVIQSITGVGATSGTWTHHLRYVPLARGVTVS